MKNKNLSQWQETSDDNENKKDNANINSQEMA